MKVRKQFLALCMALTVAVMPGSAVIGHAVQSETAGAPAEDFLKEEFHLEEDDDPVNEDIVISSTNDLKLFAVNLNSGDTYEGKTVRLSGDIEFDGTTLNNFETIGASNLRFEGTFDGGGYTISGIVQAGKYYAGLFFAVGSKGVVQNLTLQNALFLTAGSGRAGGIAVYNYGQIRNCRVLDSTLSCVTNGSCTCDKGGCAGDNYGVIDACEVKGTIVQGHDDVGGIVGRGGAGTIMNCISSAAVSGYYTGGIMASGAGNSIVNCANLGEITTGDGYGGGIIGCSENSNVVQNCYNSGVISGDVDGNTGGLMGVVSDNNMLSSCYYSLEGCSQAYGAGSPMVQNDVVARTAAQMQSQSFLALLNTHCSQNPDWMLWRFRPGCVYPVH